MCGDFVPNGVAKEGWMCSTRAHIGTNAPDDIGRAAAIIQEGDVLLPGQADHDVEGVFLSDIEEPAGRRGVGANGVKAAGGNLGKIAADAGGSVVFAVGGRA